MKCPIHGIEARSSVISESLPKISSLDIINFKHYRLIQVQILLAYSWAQEHKQSFQCILKIQETPVVGDSLLAKTLTDKDNKALYRPSPRQPLRLSSSSAIFLMEVMPVMTNHHRLFQCSYTFSFDKLCEAASTKRTFRTSIKSLAHICSGTAEAKENIDMEQRRSEGHRRLKKHWVPHDRSLKNKNNSFRQAQENSSVSYTIALKARFSERLWIFLFFLFLPSLISDNSIR